MKRIALHWQILIALIIAIFYGIVFKTNYQISSQAIGLLRQSEIPSEVVDIIETLKGKTYASKQAVEKAMVEHNIDFEKYKSSIIKSCYSNKAVNRVSWMGDIFLRALKMLIIPLVLSSLVSGVSNLGGGDNLGRLGLKTILYYLLTSSLAIITGLFFVNIIKPGIGADTSFEQEVEGLDAGAGSIGQTLIEIIPENIFEAMNDGKMLPIIFFAIVVGFFINKINGKYKVVLSDFFNAFFELMMKVTMWVIRFTPIGVFGIVAKVVADQDNLMGLVSSMGLYMGTVILALFVHSVITLPTLTKLIGKSSPIKLFRSVSTPLLTAFSTSSSGATLPLTISAVEKNAGVSNKISSFTLPLGATINMDGTALYELVAAMFIAQAYGIEMNFVQQLIMVATALLASIGAAAIPMAGMVMLTIVLSAVGLPLEGVGLILAVDRILDMFRTSINVWSDTCGSVIIARSEGENLNV